MQLFYCFVFNIFKEILVFIYVGDVDYICNWFGNQVWIEVFEWFGKKNFNKVFIKDLKFVGVEKEYGKVKVFGNFIFMQVYQVGYMVFMDQFENFFDFLNWWLGGEWFVK